MGGHQIRSSAAVSRSRSYFDSRNDKLYAVDIPSQKLRWKFETGGGIDSSPAVVEGVVYLERNDSNLCAVDGETGQEK